MYCLFCIVLCIVCMWMCTALLPPGDNPIAVNKYIISYITSHHISYHVSYHIISAVMIFFYIFTFFTRIKSLSFILWTYPLHLFSSRKHFSLRKFLHRSIVFPSSLRVSLAQPGPHVILIFHTRLVLFSWRWKQQISINHVKSTGYVMHHKV
jgi:membrane-associated HD superfamily phosphohydrolase